MSSSLVPPFTWRTRRCNGYNILPEVKNQAGTEAGIAHVIVAASEAVARKERADVMLGLDSALTVSHYLDHHKGNSDEVLLKKKSWNYNVEWFKQHGIPYEIDYWPDATPAVKVVDIVHGSCSSADKIAGLIEESPIIMRLPMADDFDLECGKGLYEAKGKLKMDPAVRFCFVDVVLVGHFLHSRKDRYFEYMSCFGEQWGSGGFGYVSPELVERCSYYVPQITV